MLGISKSITIYMFLILGKIYQVGYTTVCFKILRKDVYFEGTISISIKERKAKESSSVKTIFFPILEMVIFCIFFTQSYCYKKVNLFKTLAIA